MSKKSVVVNKYECGGLNFFDFASLNNTFKINWLKQYLADPDSFWNILPNIVFSKVGGLPFLLFCNYSITKLPLKLSNFHKQVLLAWHLIYKHNFSPHSYFIWNNGDILYKNKSLFFPNWVNNNIILVSQLLNSNGYLYFLKKYDIPVTPREFAIVMDAIPAGAITLLKDSASLQFSLSMIHPFGTVIGKICFLSTSSGGFNFSSIYCVPL
ncbi:Protein TIC 214 [Labeo rohita]|uniref:Protein TIC 214 n=1 Tax=Labeo rohita TaxID=84645 RepID=A0ABQ8LTG5_LABRO|nr:Protein TIC 214 [Labeo rohita]